MLLQRAEPEAHWAPDAVPGAAGVGAAASSFPEQNVPVLVSGGDSWCLAEVHMIVLCVS